MTSTDVFAPLRALVRDPRVSGIDRLPMRPLAVPFPDADSARQDRPDASPWWRSLDGTWDLQMFDSLEQLAPRALTEPSGDDIEVQVPSAWTTQRDADGNRLVAPHYTNVIMPFDADPPAVPDANPVGVYRRSVTIPRDWRGRRVVLRVGAAESVVAAYVDGEFVGAGTDSRLPNEFDLTAHVRAGRKALIALIVARWSAATWLEDQDQWWHGGIQRSVTLYSTEATHLSGLAIRPGLDLPDTGTLDYEFVVEGAARREDGWTVELSVETLDGPRPGRQVATTGPQTVPIWRCENEAEQLLSGVFVEPGVLRSRLDVPGVRPWHHEAPTRYRALIILRDPQGRTVEVASLRTGFRSLEIADNELRINGQPVMIHGVNLHEHDPERGRTVDADQTRRDLVLMKQHNMNAVRAAHYPHDEHLAELCDELGLYLVDEANVETHARQTSLCQDPRFGPAIVERIERMVCRDLHHPSIIMWSLGNESGDGPPHAAAAALVRSLDPSRPLHYEGPLMHDLYAAAPVTDVVCPMYTPIDEIVAWAESGRDLRRPLIMCEYSHAMGNANGSLSDYWAAFESTHGLQGGFIWEWVEHGLPRDVGADGAPVGAGPGGRISWGFGGDFGETPHDANFICDGLVSADRVPHPAMREVHHVGRPVRVEPVIGRRQLRIHNRRWFSGLADLRARFELTVDGAVVERGELDVPEIAPRSSAHVAVPLRLPRVAPGAEVHLLVRWTQRRATAWCAAGHEVGHDQFALDAAVSTRRPSPTGIPAAGTPVPGAVDVAALRWQPTVFRALTDNDGIRLGWMRGYVGSLARWVDQWGLDRCTWQAEPERRRAVDGAIRRTQRGQLMPAGPVPGVEVRRRVVEREDGWSQVVVEFDVPAELSDLPRIGTEWQLPGEFGRVEWFGDGPHECYSDRRGAAVVGRHAAGVEDMYVDYVLPQEHGHRTGVRWVALRRSPRSGLVVVADPDVGDGTVGMSVRRHSDAELWACAHTDELARLEQQRPPITWLGLDAGQRGIGTSACGPDALAQYRLAAGRHVVSTWWRSFDPRSEDPGELAAQVRR